MHDEVRRAANDWDFSEEGQEKDKLKRMSDSADKL